MGKFHNIQQQSQEDIQVTCLETFKKYDTSRRCSVDKELLKHIIQDVCRTLGNCMISEEINEALTETQKKFRTIEKDKINEEEFFEFFTIFIGRCVEDEKMLFN